MPKRPYLTSYMDSLQGRKEERKVLKSFWTQSRMRNIFKIQSICQESKREKTSFLELKSIENSSTK